MFIPLGAGRTGPAGEERSRTKSFIRVNTMKNRTRRQLITSAAGAAAAWCNGAHRARPRRQ